MSAKPYETFDIDLLEGKAREGAFARVLCQVTFEHKRDYQTITTGNVAIEFEEKRGTEKRLSGISITTAEWWVVEFDIDSWILVPVEKAKRLARLAIKADKHAWIGDGNNHHNALVPFIWFLRPPLQEAK